MHSSTPDTVQGCQHSLLTTTTVLSPVFIMSASAINTNPSSSEDEAEANADDPVLSRMDVQDRVGTLVATGGNGKYSHDIHLQGPQETVFFDI